MENQVLQLLQQAPGVLFSTKEVGKKVDRERYREDPSWARPFLRSLEERKVIQRDDSGAYFYPKAKI